MIPVAYYTGVPNVGDLSNANIVSIINKSGSYQTRDVDKPHLLAVGSTMEWSRPASIVWGTGVMDPQRGIGSVLSENIFALRGKLSHKAFADEGVFIDVPLGDPGFLLPHLLSINLTGEDYLGVVPHYAERNLPVFINLMEREGVKLLDVNNLHIEAFLREMASCAAVISSSLHGLIFAESLGIPNLWVSAGGEVQGNGFKFRDWFSTTRVQVMEPLCLTSSYEPMDLKRASILHESIINVDDLIGCFPKESLFDNSASSGDGQMLSYQACREEPIHIFFDVSRPPIPDNLQLSLDSIGNGFPRSKVVFVGRHSPQLRGFPGIFSTIHFSEREGIDDEFMKKFFACWAEPQRHIVAEIGFDFSQIVLERDVDAVLNARPQLDAITIDNAGKRLICRRAGRWW